MAAEAGTQFQSKSLCNGITTKLRSLLIAFEKEHKNLLPPGAQLLTMGMQIQQLTCFPILDNAVKCLLHQH